MPPRKPTLSDLTKPVQKGLDIIQGGSSATSSSSSGGSAGGSPQLVRDNLNTLKSYTDSFWQYHNPSVTKWGELYPYQLRVVKPVDGGYKTVAGMSFTLPITPQQLQVRTPFAVLTSVTLRGILEEHNGAPLREIMFAGTTGVWPFRKQAAQPTSPTSIESIFGGTLSAVQGLTSAVKTLTGQKQNKANLSDPGTNDDATEILGGTGTGYYQFHLLYQFLEKYVQAKRGNVGNNVFGEKPHLLRLAFCMWKDDWVWLISPKEFVLVRSANDPFEYNYQFSATAWKRVNGLDESTSARILYTPISERRNGFQQVLDGLQNARNVLQSGQRVLEAARADINRAVFEPIRETIFAMKDVVGIGSTLIDLPSALTKDFQHTVIKEWGNLRGTVDQKFGRRAPSTGDPRPIALLMENAFRRAVQNKETSLPTQSADPLNKIFSSPINSLSFFDSINVDSLNADPNLLLKVNDEVDRVKTFSRRDYEDKRKDILATSADTANYLGLGNDTYNRLIGRSQLGDSSDVLPELKTTLKEPSPDSLNVLFALQEASMQFDRLTASYTVDDSKIVDRINFIAALASDADIEFEIPNSKFAVPVPFGMTVEGISNLYLGTPDRWLEIATLNNLQAPYIDEEGFVRSLLTNGSGTKFNVNNKLNLFVGHQVKLSSSTVPSFSRRILSIEEIAVDNILVTVDGEANLDILQTADNAQMKAYLPHTANSEQLIFIPSDEPAKQSDLKVRPLPGISDLNKLVKISGIDLLLTHDGDLAVTPDGDVKLAYGLTNIIQAARLKLETPKGSLIRHPSFGFGIQVGISTADVSAQSVFNSVQSSFLEDDRFKGIDSLTVIKKGPVLQISLLAGVSGVDTLIPITVQTLG